MLSYQNDPALKSRFCAHIERHRIEDRILQGLYGGLVEGEWKGCAVGCALRSLDEIDGKTRTEYQDHEALATRLDIPLWLARLQDSVFEGLSREDSKRWPTRLANAMPVGRDLERVWPKFAYWLLADPVAGVIRFAGNAPSKKAISDVAKLYQRWIAGDKPSSTEWRQARSAAYAANAATAANAAAATDAAYAAATDAAYAAAYAANAATAANAAAATDAAYAAATDATYAAAADATYAAAAAANTAADATNAAAAANAAAANAANAAYAANAAANAAARESHWKLISDKLCELIADA